LAKDQVGYHNLQFLNSKGFLEGFYYNPRIDKALLKERSQGLIGLSACLGGEVAQSLQRGGYAAAKEAALEYASLFDQGDFYLELMDNGIPEQAVLNGELKRISHETGIPVVATGDCHYVRRTDAKAHEVLMAIQQGRTLADEKRLSHSVDAFYIKSAAEFEAAFHDLPQALESTVDIAKRCNVELKLGETYLPRYKVPPEFGVGDSADLDGYCAKVARDGLEKRFAEKASRNEKFDVDQYRARLEDELKILCKMGFAGYFLIVWDFINYAKTQSIPVGPGRG
jgi:DNA polymerase-3 subunit alpha